MIKATVYYKDYSTGNYRRKTVEVEKNEPCSIVREFISSTKCSRYTYITHIRCGKYDYQWRGDATGAFLS